MCFNYQHHLRKFNCFSCYNSFSKYVPAGSVRVNVTTKGSSSLESTAFITPEKDTVVIIMNTGDQAIDLKLYDTAYSKALAINALPHSIQTYLYHVK